MKFVDYFDIGGNNLSLSDVPVDFKDLVQGLDTEKIQFLVNGNITVLIC